MVKPFDFSKCVSHVKTSWHYDITIEHILRYTILNISYIHVIIHKLYKSKSSEKKLTDLHYIVDKNRHDYKLSQKSLHTQSRRKTSVHKLSFGHVQILEKKFSYIILITQSVLSNYTIWLNWENERTSVQFNILNLNAPPPNFGKSPHMTSAPIKMKKNSNPPQKNFRGPKSPPPHSLGGGGGEDTMDCIYTFLYWEKFLCKKCG